MGSCTSKKKPIQLSTKKLPEIEPVLQNKLPNSFYLHRGEKSVYTIFQERLLVSSFEDKIKLKPDSAISYLSEDRLIVGGGTSSTGCLSNEVFVIDLSSKRVECLQELPILAKEGSFYQCGSFIYYAGGVTMPEREDSVFKEIPAPLMRLDLLKNRWEIFRSIPASATTVQKVMKGNLQATLEDIEILFEEEDEFSLESLLYPGTFMRAEKIYFIGGIVISKDGTLVPNTSVFSVEVSNIAFTVEDFKFLYPVVKPLCAENGNSAVILGGFDPLTWEPLQSVFFLKQKEIEQGEDLPLALKENHSVAYNEDLVVFSFPSVMMYIDKKWKTVGLGELERSNCEEKIKTLWTTEKKDFQFIDAQLSIKSPCQTDRSGAISPRPKKVKNYPSEEEVRHNITEYHSDSDEFSWPKIPDIYASAKKSKKSDKKDFPKSVEQSVDLSVIEIERCNKSVNIPIKIEREVSFADSDILNDSQDFTFGAEPLATKMLRDDMSEEFTSFKD